jgi:hypothetical protein
MVVVEFQQQHFTTREGRIRLSTTTITTAGGIQLQREGEFT